MRTRATSRVLSLRVSNDELAEFQELCKTLGYQPVTMQRWAWNQMIHHLRAEAERRAAFRGDTIDT